MKVSLIVPVYYAEKTLPATLESIRTQRFRDFEVIFVEDAGNDGSLTLLKDFCHTSGLSCQLLRQASNQGAAAARNRGLEAAKGDYLAFADADDRLEPDLLERAVQAAEGGADIVGWDWVLDRKQNGRIMRQADYQTPIEAFKALTGGIMRWNLWLFLLRRELVDANGIRFIPGADIGEDMQFMLRAFLYAREVVQLHTPLYHYNAVNESSISKAFTPKKRKQVETNLSSAERAWQTSAAYTALPDAMLDLKLFLKRPLLIGTNRGNYETWYNWFPEANDRAEERAALPLHTWLLQAMASRRMWTGVRLYYLLVHKLVYGILYR